MWSSIRGRLTLWYTTVFIFVFSLTGIAVLLMLDHVLVDDISQRTLGAVDEVHRSLAAGGEPGSGGEGEMSYTLLKDPDLLQTGSGSDVFLRILDPLGNTVNHSPSLPPSRFATVSPAGLSAAGPTRLVLDGHSYLFTRDPLRRGDRVVGWLEAYGSLESVDRTLMWLGWLLGAGALAGGVLAALGGYLVSTAAFRRVDTVIATAHHIMQGDLDKRLQLRPPKDELYRLAAVFNEMIDSIQAAMERQVAFVADASHELRTPVTVIAGYVNLLRRWAQTEPAVGDEALDAIVRETDRMTRLTSRLLRLAAAGPLEPHRRQRVDLTALLQGLLEDAQAVAEERTLSIRADIQQDLWVDGDAERLHEMFWAFIDNAIKYSRPGGEIDIEAHPGKDDILVRVRDTGVGMTPEQTAHIFERFYRADPARQRQAESFGLGLAIARETIRAHHGNVTVQSEPGRGTVFEITLPVGREGFSAGRR